MMLLACRSITHLIDILPAACASVVHNQAVPALCAKLLNIEYIDLAEQAMSALEKLSVEHGIVRSRLRNSSNVMFSAGCFEGRRTWRRAVVP